MTRAGAARPAEVLLLHVTLLRLLLVLLFAGDATLRRWSLATFLSDVKAPSVVMSAATEIEEGVVGLVLGRSSCTKEESLRSCSGVWITVTSPVFGVLFGSVLVARPFSTSSCHLNTLLLPSGRPVSSKRSLQSKRKSLKEPLRPWRWSIESST